MKFPAINKSLTLLEVSGTPIDICCAMPTYDSADIIWLQLESLCRQQTKYNWEIIICEEKSEKYFGPEGIVKYIDRLQKAGCKRIVYIELSEYVSLSQKWVMIANEAKGSSFLLTASDNYSPPNRLTLTHNKLKKFNWFDVGSVMFLHLPSFKRGQFKTVAPARQRPIGRPPGPFKATKTHYLKKLKGPWPNKGVDTWIIVKGKVKKRYKHPTPLLGVCTDGANKITLTRSLRYVKSGEYGSKPFGRCFAASKQSLNDILPQDIKKRLKKQFYTG